MTERMPRAAGNVTGEAIPNAISSVREDDAQQSVGANSKGGGMVLPSSGSTRRVEKGNQHMNYGEMVREFYSVKRGSIPTVREAWDLLVEEVRELEMAAGGEETDELKEMADVMYTLYGYAVAQGYDLDGAFSLVHESNMTKERTETGKVQKGPSYRAPDLSTAVGKPVPTPSMSREES